jgi:DNA polymerase III epsilon subunit-like protein
MPDTTTRPEDPSTPAIDWLLCRYVAIDVEGTASPAGQPEGLVEVAAVEFTLDRPAGRTIHSLLDPGMPITAIGTRIHGLHDSDVAGQPTLTSLCPRLSGLIDGAVVVAHNARVDWGLMHRDCPQLQPAAAVDTLRISRALWPELRQHGLDPVIERLGIQVDLPAGSTRGGRHTALHDATATVQIFIRMVETARDRSLGLVGLLDGCILPGSRSVPAPESQMDLFAGGTA